MPATGLAWQEAWARSSPAAPAPMLVALQPEGAAPDADGEVAAPPDALSAESGLPAAVAHLPAPNLAETLVLGLTQAAPLPLPPAIAVTPAPGTDPARLVITASVAPQGPAVPGGAVQPDLPAAPALPQPAGEPSAVPAQADAPARPAASPPQEPVAAAPAPPVAAADAAPAFPADSPPDARSDAGARGAGAPAPTTAPPDNGPAQDEGRRHRDDQPRPAAPRLAEGAATAPPPAAAMPDAAPPAAVAAAVPGDFTLHTLTAGGVSATPPPGTPPAALPATAPLPTPAALSAQIVVALPPAGGDTVVSLSPAELGTLHLRVSGEGDAMRLTILADRPETLDLLRRHADALRAELAGSGFGGAQLSFGQSNGQSAGQFTGQSAGHSAGQSAQAAPQAPGAQDADPRTLPALASAPPPGAALRGLLHLRL